MKLDKAIKVLGDYKMESAFEATPDFEDALKLGIEALKRHKHNESCFEPGAVKPLPGETEE